MEKEQHFKSWDQSNQILILATIEKQLVLTEAKRPDLLRCMNLANPIVVVGKKENQKRYIRLDDRPENQALPIIIGQYL